jgi:putative membrane protein
MNAIPYCGRPPLPGALAERWNFDPVALTALVAIAVLYALLTRRRPTRARYQMVAFAAGLCVVAVAVVSPLCAFAVALFSARMAQHLLLVLVAAPLLAVGCLDGGSGRQDRGRRTAVESFVTAFLFAVCWWFWHAPGPYDAALRSTFLYAAMQTTLIASAFGLWRVVTRSADLGSFVISLASAVHMGLLGALLTFAPEPLHTSHLTTTASWGLSALEDQQLAGLLCWVPACGFFVLTGLGLAAHWLEGQGNVPATKRLLEARSDSSSR